MKKKKNDNWANNTANKAFTAILRYDNKGNLYVNVKDIEAESLLKEMDEIGVKMRYYQAILEEYVADFQRIWQEISNAMYSKMSREERLQLPIPYQLLYKSPRLFIKKRGMKE